MIAATTAGPVQRGPAVPLWRAEPLARVAGARGFLDASVEVVVSRLRDLGIVERYLGVVVAVAELETGGSGHVLVLTGATKLVPISWSTGERGTRRSPAGDVAFSLATVASIESATTRIGSPS